MNTIHIIFTESGETNKDSEEWVDAELWSVECLPDTPKPPIDSRIRSIQIGDSTTISRVDETRFKRVATLASLLSHRSESETPNWFYIEPKHRFRFEEEINIEPIYYNTDLLLKNNTDSLLDTHK